MIMIIIISLFCIICIIWLPLLNTDKFHITYIIKIHGTVSVLFDKISTLHGASPRPFTLIVLKELVSCNALWMVLKACQTHGRLGLSPTGDSTQAFGSSAALGVHSSVFLISLLTVFHSSSLLFFLSSSPPFPFFFLPLVLSSLLILSRL